MGVVTLEKAIKLSDEIKPVMVVIPALNEAENLAHVLSLMPKQIDGMDIGVLVVDDGSEDDTRDICKRVGLHGGFKSNQPGRRGRSPVRL